MTPTTKATWQLKWRDRVYFSHLTETSCELATLFPLHLQLKFLQGVEMVLACPDTGYRSTHRYSPRAHAGLSIYASVQNLEMN